MTHVNIPHFSRFPRSVKSPHTIRPNLAAGLIPRNSVMQQVRSVLNYYPLDFQPLQIELLGSAGGMSGAQFWRVAVVRGSLDPALADPAPAALCLRRWPPEHPTPERLRFIHAVLAHAARNGITFLPVPLRAVGGESFVQHAGHLWELAPWMPGAADFDRAPTSTRLQAAMQALAQFHVAVRDFKAPRPLGSAASAISRRLTMLRQLLAGGSDDLSRAITTTTWPELAPLARQFIAALPAAIPRAIAELEPLADLPLPLQPCLRDIWHDHVLFTGNEVTGIVDFGAVDVDTPATDIARLLGSLASISPPRRGEGVGEGPHEADIWRDGLAAYATMRPLSEGEVRAVAALDTSGTILAGCNWIRWVYVERRQFENQAAIVERFCRLLVRLKS